MAQSEQVDVLVLGSGEAGKYLAWHMAQAGQRTAVVERQWVGGSCPNINCLPSKNEIWSAKVADLVHRAAAFGTMTGSGSVDMARVRQRKRDMVEGLIALHLERYRASGAELVMGTGAFVAPHTLEVRLNDGGTRRLVGERVSLLVRTPHREQTLDGSDLLVAVGRTPNTAGIGLHVAGVEVDGRGYIKVNDRLETTAPDVWAMGECAGSAQFTHVSFDDFRIIRDNLAGGRRTTRDRLIPFCLFTDPPLARVGLNEREARRRGVEVRVATLPISAVLRTRTIAETQGFMKALVDAQSDRILGFTMLGPEAGEVMAVVQTAMLAGMPYPGLRDAILTHPTMAEGLGSLFANVPAKATPPRAHA